MPQPNIGQILVDLLKKRQEKYVVPEEKKFGLPTWVILLITALIMFVYFFVSLPALNPQSGEFYMFLIITLVVFNGLNLIFGKSHKGFFAGLSGGIMIALFVIPIIMSFFSGAFFHAKAYSQLIQVETGVFADEVKKIHLDQIPIVDRDAAVVIGEKQLGGMGDLVSQFEIDQTYSQINVKGKPIRVSPLRYYDLIKYVMNFKGGLPYYVSIDMTNQDGSMVKLDKPIIYSASDILMRNISRHLRFQFPFTMLGETNFELDDNGSPFYVTPILAKRIFFFGGLDVNGVIVTDANSGQSTVYKLNEVPEWIDRVYPADMIISQLDARGLYASGFINSVFGQKNVTVTTDGYNYVSIDQDIWVVTGVTSVRSDESNLGFYYVNLRTKEARFYPQSSATEYAAMESAQGKVQEKGYVAAFPVVLNLADRPVYFIGLKDATRIAKMFAIVDAERFDTVFTGNTPAEAVQAYLTANSTAGQISDKSLSKTITITSIKEAVIDGNSIYFVTVNQDQLVYTATAKALGADILKLQVGQTIKVIGNATDTSFEILQIEK